MNYGKKDLLVTLLQAGEYISCTEENQEEVIGAVNDLKSVVIYILGDDSTGKCFLSLKQEAFQTQTRGDIIELFRGYNGIFFPIIL